MSYQTPAGDLNTAPPAVAGRDTISVKGHLCAAMNMTQRGLSMALRRQRCGERQQPGTAQVRLPRSGQVEKKENQTLPPETKGQSLLTASEQSTSRQSSAHLYGDSQSRELLTYLDR